MVYTQKIYGIGQNSFNTMKLSAPQGLENTSFYIYVISGANLMFSPSLDMSPILMYPVLLTAGKVTKFAELPTLAPTSGTLAWKLILASLFGGVDGAEGWHLLLGSSSSQSPQRGGGEHCRQPGPMQHRQIPPRWERGMQSLRKACRAEFCLTSRGQTAFSMREQDFKITKRLSAYLCKPKQVSPTPGPSPLSQF